MLVRRELYRTFNPLQAEELQEKCHPVHRMALFPELSIRHKVDRKATNSAQFPQDPGQRKYQIPRTKYRFLFLPRNFLRQINHLGRVVLQVGGAAEKDRKPVFGVFHAFGGVESPPVLA